MGPEQLKREITKAQKGEGHANLASKDPDVIVVSAGRTWTIEKIWVDACGDINIDILPKGRS